MGVTAKLPMLLSTPFPLLGPRPSLIHLPMRPHLPLSSFSFALSGAAQHHAFSCCSQPRHGHLLRAAAEQAHTQTGVVEDVGDLFSSTPESDGFWPEWVKMVEHVTAGGYVGRRGSPAHGEDEEEDAFSVSEGLSEEYTRAAGACLLFAREKPDLLSLLPKSDVEIVVENGSPFLFKNALNSVRRMKSFISSDGSHIFQNLESEQAHTFDVMRYLLSYVCNSVDKKGGDDTKHRDLVEASVRRLLSELVKADSAVREPNTMNSAAGHMSFRHEQSQKFPEQTIGTKRGDWTCPKCNFMNFARNTECLECKMVRPRKQLTGKEWECPQCDFFNHGRNTACLRCDCKCPEEISTLERRLGSVPSMHSSGNEDSAGASVSMGGTEPEKMTDSAISQRLDRILGRSPATSETKDTVNQSVPGGAGVRAGRRFTSLERKDPGYVPFVPLPADMFRKKPAEGQQPSVKEVFTSVKADQLTDAVSQGPVSGKPGDSSYSEDFNNVTMAKTNKESSDLSERLTRDPAQQPDDNSLPTSTLDDDFPEIMPMRKGENRFVISKKKDRSLTSPQYKRRIALEQASNSNFVPFVPFPPGYFAKKDQQPEDGSSTSKSADKKFPATSPVAGNIDSKTQKDEKNENGENNWGASGNIRQTGSTETNRKMEELTLAQHTDRLWNNNTGNLSSGSSQETAAGWSTVDRQVENPQDKAESGGRAFSGKSLEGSAVTEPDPLDMSEEAKAQRWFRRVAQINDISELSKIPDEDFPEIMPMRKGVNRFVVSKRKTPLERRLTTQQYRGNLPMVSSEPEKDSS